MVTGTALVGRRGAVVLLVWLGCVLGVAIACAYGVGVLFVAVWAPEAASEFPQAGHEGPLFDIGPDFEWFVRGAMVGLVAGLVAGLVVSVLATWLWHRRRLANRNAERSS